MCTDVALLRKKRCIVFDERKWLNVKVYRDLMIIRYIIKRSTNTRKREMKLILLLAKSLVV